MKNDNSDPIKQIDSNCGTLFSDHSDECVNIENKEEMISLEEKIASSPFKFYGTKPELDLFLSDIDFATGRRKIRCITTISHSAKE